MFKKSIGISVLIGLSIIMMHCEKEVSSTSTKSGDGKKHIENAKDAPVPVAVVTKIEINYTAFAFPKKKKDSAMAAFVKKYSKEERYIILALNRLDDKNKWRADTLIIPDKIEKDFLVYAPFPTKMDVLKDVNKMVFFSYDVEAFAIYENGNLLKWGPSSLGKKNTPTEKGLTFTNWKKEVAISTVDSSWKLRWNFNIYNKLGIGWHQYDLPGYNASHSCLRLLEDDAKYLYGWANQWKLNESGSEMDARGTAVFVYGNSDFKTKPWRSLLKDNHSNDISEAALTEIIKSSIPKILEEQKNSDEQRQLVAKNDSPQKQSDLQTPE